MAHHLVIQLARFGDVIQTKRLLLSLSAKPGDVIHLAVDISLAVLARQVYPFAVVHGIHAHATNARAVEVLFHNRNAFAALAEISFTSVYTLNFSGMTLSLAGLFDPDIVHGYSRDHGQVFRSRWLRMGFRWMANRRMAPLNLVDLWACLHPDPIDPVLVNPKPKPGGGKKIAIVAAGREARRSLPPEILAPLVASAFAACGGPEVVILGSNAERLFARKLARLLPPAVLQKMDDACGRTSLLDLPNILADCDLVLTPDTGIMHLAAHMGVPIMAFFLSSAWCFETGPYGEGHTIFQATRTCAPCVETRPCPCNVACLPPFAAPEIVQCVRGKEPTAWPGDLVLLRSVCDTLGCDYVPLLGEVSENQNREDLRALLTEYRGKGGVGAIPDWVAKTVFHETDWILPPPLLADDFLTRIPEGE